MAPAQGLVVMAQLGKRSQAMAPRLAALFLALYLLSVVPLTLWSAAFLTLLGPLL